MQYLKCSFLSLLIVVCLSLAGCGGSSTGSGTVNDPMAAQTSGGSGGTPIFGNIDSETGTTGITLTTDRSTVDVINGQVLVTAKLTNNNVAVAGVPVTFRIAAPTNGPATIEAGLTTVNTDSNGEARTRITTGNTLSTTNVIVSASATIGTQLALANTTFQIVRGTAVINVGSLPVKSATVDPSVEANQVFQQQIPIKLTDSNGNSRVGTPVTISVYSQSGTSLVLFNQQSVNTDASGTAIFNATVTMTSPASGLTAVDSIIYKVATSDANPIVAYAAGYYSLTSIVASSTQPSIILTTDSTTYDINDGSVLATAKVVRNGAAVSGVPVTFSIVAPANGPATIETGLGSVTTDSNGVAVTRIRTGSVLSTTNVIIQAVATIGTQTVNATTTFQIVPTVVVQPSITLTTDKSVYDVNSGSVLVTAKVVRNGAPVSGAQVNFSITESTNGPSTIEAGLTSVVTDSNGVAVTRITTGNVLSSTNVIVNASATVGSQIFTATATFMIVPDITKPSIILTTDRDIYENNGIVTATATMIKDGVAVFGVPVTYTVLSGPVTLGYFTPTTDRNGKSIANFTVGSSSAATNAIIQAAATVGGTTYIAYTKFQVNGFDPGALPVPTVNMTLTSDLAQVDVNNGTVMLNANLIYGTDYLVNNNFIPHGTTIADQPVTFSVLVGPATIAGSTPQTDKNGNSKAILTTGNTLITTNVIVEASTVFDGKTYRAYTTIQIVRGTGDIKFITGKEPTDPDGTLNTLSYSVRHDSTATTVTFPQLIPFKVTDSNGNPRVGVPVTLDVYSQSGLAGIVINYLKNGVVEPSANTVTTDSNGEGIFNITVTVPVPATPGFTYSEGIVYKGVTNDPIPLTAYGGFIVSVTREPTPLTAP